MISISTHVLDTATGDPAAGISVSLSRLDGDSWIELADRVTDDDGRVGEMGNDLDPGSYRLRFDTGGYGNRFYPSVSIDVDLDESRDHYHLPLLLSPFGYSTYRGS